MLLIGRPKQRQRRPGEKMYITGQTTSSVRFSLLSLLLWSLLFLQCFCLFQTVQGSQQPPPNDHQQQTQQRHQQQQRQDEDSEEQQPDDATFESEWYQRYPQYPQYCSTPQQMNQRNIPPLPDVSSHGSGKPRKIPETRLRHVTAVLRHGARTIASKESPCWDGYWTDPETAKWHCPLTERLAPPTPSEILQEEGTSASSGASSTPVEILQSMFLFQKNFDTRPNRNVLEGTCQLGQLMAQGYEQLVYNGNMLRDTYLYDEGTMGHDERMRLYSLPAKIPGGPDNTAGSTTTTNDPTKPPWEEPNFYLRSENSQPTMVSGQLIMQGLFGPELAFAHQSIWHDQTYATVPVHTGDLSRDIMTGIVSHSSIGAATKPSWMKNPSSACPKLDYIKNQAETSQEFFDFYNSDSSMEVQDFMNKHLTYDTQLFDCLMTTVCTDRPLPSRFGIYSPNPQSWFERISKYHSTNHSFHYQYNNSEYSKMNIGPLWAEILEHIQPVLEEVEVGERERPPAKMGVFSGHDTTIIQLLSSLGVWDLAEWPPYASMMLIEIHEMVDDNYDKERFTSGYAFRLLYDGKVLTSKIDGCDNNSDDDDDDPPATDLCDAQVLMDHLIPIANRAIDCSLDNDDASDGKHNVMVIAKDIVSDTLGIILIIVIVVSSALLGSIVAFFCLTGTLPKEVKEVLPNKKKNTSMNDNGLNGGEYHDNTNGRATAGIEPFEITMADGEAYEE